MTRNQQRRKLISVVLGSCVLLLFAGLATLNAFNLKFLNPSGIFQIFFFTGLSTLAFLLFVAVLVLLVRNVLKLYADQRSRVLGTRLRVRMLWGAVLVSLVPLAFMFTFSYLLMNRAVDRWFSQPVTEMRDDSTRIALQLSQYTSANARAEAEAIASSLPEAPLAGVETPRGDVSAADTQRRTIEGLLRQREITLQSGFACVFREGKAVAAFQLPRPSSSPPQVKPWLQETPTRENGDELARDNKANLKRNSIGPALSTEDAILAAAQRTDQPLLSLGQADYALGTAALKSGGTVVVGLPVPYGLPATMTRLNAAADAYWTLFRSRRQIRSLYSLLLLMVTSLALFACCWLALHLSKQVTRPVEALADAMDLIASGDYGHRVQESATDELGDLVRSFNRMATDLESSRQALLESTVQLSAANAAVEARRAELETMLETIPNGVATLTPERRIALANRALSEMMDPGGQRSFPGAFISSVVPEEVSETLDHLIRRSHRMGTASAELELHASSAVGRAGFTNLLVTVALLETFTDRGREHRGYVVVLENATELLRAQKQSAWKEVARRVAHEIKNPLTPIALSAEQTLRHVARLEELLNARAVQSNSPGVIRRCSETITSSVNSMRSLVDQFAALAEFPTAQPRPADLNTIVENSLALFAGRLQNVRVVRHLAPELPLVMVDPEALKRALTNLIDNAAEAMTTALLRELHVSTALLAGGLVELVVADTGTGLTDEMRERLFLPYFSTKQRGTGLGLAIAAKIVQEHQGTIRAENQQPVGARFIIELRPVAGSNNEHEPEAESLPAVTAGARQGGTMIHVLIVDDEAEIRESLSSILTEEGYETATAATGTEALELVRDAAYDVILLDIWLPDRDGLDVLAEIRSVGASRAPEVVIVSGHGTIEAAVRATKLGAYDFLEKPLSLDRTLIVLKNAAQARRLREDNEEFALQLGGRAAITGESVSIKALRQQIKLMAPTNGRVLIFGESGTGKELIGRAMHAESLRKARPFVELNCAAIPEDYIDSELFGFRHGAGPAGASGPAEQRGGMFERADGGTLFLDEVGDMTLKTQAKVLRALDEQRFLPVGASHPVHVDVRVIAATNKDLEEEIVRGNFREDLFYRLNVIPFYVPPLRDRKEDIGPLVQEFLAEFGKQYGRQHVDMSGEAVQVLRQYNWPGNVRELRNLVERVLILNPRVQRIERKHLPMLLYRENSRDARTRKASAKRKRSFSDTSITLLEAREAYERDFILKKIDEHHGNISRAAGALGLERSHLYRKMKALGVPVKE